MMYAFQARAKELKIVLVYGPLNRTDVAAPVDAGWRDSQAALQQKLYEADYEKNTHRSV